MKRFLLITVALALIVLGGCSDNLSGEYSSKLNSAVQKANDESRVNGEYSLSITFSEGAVLYHALGDIAWDREAKTAFAEFNQTYLGDSSVMKNYFNNGKMISIDDGEAAESSRDANELFSKFPYFSALLHDEKCGEITLGTNSTGETYTFVRTDTAEIFDSLVGGDLYSLVFSIKNPQPEKTKYSDMECVYTVSDGSVVSCRYEFDVKLFDTPTYIPGYSQPESDYTIDLHISAKVTYNLFGDGVTVEEYSGDASEHESK